jgi:adenine phosphoribosyltransferase
MASRKRAGKRPVTARRIPTLRGAEHQKPAVSTPKPITSLRHALGIEPMKYARDLIRDVPDFPKAGIVFKDLTPMLADARALAFVIDALAARFIGEALDAVVAVESRGFIFGAVLATRLNLAFVPVRKPGKLPSATESVSYSLEYGTAELQIHKDALAPASRVLVVDDLLATGGTAAAAGELVRRCGANVSAYVFVVELVGLMGRKALEPSLVHSLIQYE